jgi:hypothetical protein
VLHKCPGSMILQLTTCRNCPYAGGMREFLRPESRTDTRPRHRISWHPNREIGTINNRCRFSRRLLLDRQGRRHRQPDQSPKAGHLARPDIRHPIHISRAERQVRSWDDSERPRAPAGNSKRRSALCPDPGSDIAHIAERGVIDLLFFSNIGGISEDYRGGHAAVVRYGAKWPTKQRTTGSTR